MNGSLRHISAEKQFNYRKLKNQESSTLKPQRPPQPSIDTSRESILIDVSPPESDVVLRKKDNVKHDSKKAVSLLDEPIDVPEDIDFEGTLIKM